jgi:ribosomal-protein-alanine N-acetyltransferase
MNSAAKSQTKATLAVGENVYLRYPTTRDCQEFISLNRASRSLHRGLVSPPIKQEQFEVFLSRCRKRDTFCLFVCRVEDRAIIGSINLSQIVHGNFQSAYMGYFVGEPYANQRYMTEAIDLVMRYAFENLKLHRLEANIQPQNVASIALVKRAGFTLEGYSRRYLKICGRWRDHERWAILAADWKSTRVRQKGKKGVKKI